MLKRKNFVFFAITLCANAFAAPAMQNQLPHQIADDNRETSYLDGDELLEALSEEELDKLSVYLKYEPVNNDLTSVCPNGGTNCFSSIKASYSTDGGATYTLDETLFACAWWNHLLPGTSDKILLANYLATSNPTTTSCLLSIKIKEKGTKIKTKVEWTTDQTAEVNSKLNTSEGTGTAVNMAYKLYKTKPENEQPPACDKTLMRAVDNHTAGFDYDPTKTGILTGIYSVDWDLNVTKSGKSSLREAHIYPALTYYPYLTLEEAIYCAGGGIIRTVYTDQL